MCKVKTGRNVCTERDVQNLITSVILRQKRNFRRGEIVHQTKEKMKDSEIQLADQRVERMVSNTLGVLERNGIVGRKDGVYSKREVIIV